MIENKLELLAFLSDVAEKYKEYADFDDEELNGYIQLAEDMYETEIDG